MWVMQGVGAVDIDKVIFGVRRVDRQAGQVAFQGQVVGSGVGGGVGGERAPDERDGQR